MKKVVSILVASVMLLSAFSAFAAGVAIPDNLALNAVLNPDKVTKINTFARGNTKAAKATVTETGIEYEGSVGAVYDGSGMIGERVLYSSRYYQVVTGVGQTGGHIALDNMIPQNNRFVIAPNSAPTIEFEFNSAKTMDILYITQIKRTIKDYSVEYLNGTVWEKIAEGVLETSSEEVTFIDSIPFDKEITTTKIRLIIKSLLPDVSGWICEIGYGCNPYKDTEIMALKDGKLNLAAKDFVDYDDNVLNKANITVTATSANGSAPKGASDSSVEALFDGIGMIGTYGIFGFALTDGQDLIKDGAVVNNDANPMKNRFVALLDGRAYGALPPYEFTITPIEEDETISFDKIKFTEMMKVVKKYEIKIKNKAGEWVSVKQGEFTDSSSAENTYLREITLDKAYDAAAVQFIINEVHTGTTSVQITEMEFYKTTEAVSFKDAGDNAIIFENPSVNKYNLFDGKYADNSSAAGKVVFVAYDDDYNATYTLPLTISFELPEEKTFNYAELAELRCMLGEIEVWVSDDGADYNKVAIMEKMDYAADVREFVHCATFDNVSARYVKFVIKEMCNPSADLDNTSFKGITINEIALRNLTAEGEAVIYSAQAYGQALSEKIGSADVIHSLIEIENDDADPKEYSILAAKYNSLGELVDVSLDKKTVAAKSRYAVNVPVLTSGAERIHYMVWEENLVPVSPSLQLNK